MNEHFLRKEWEAFVDENWGDFDSFEYVTEEVPDFFVKHFEKTKREIIWKLKNQLNDKKLPIINPGESKATDYIRIVDVVDLLESL